MARITFEEYQAQLEERTRESICVILVGFDHMIKQTDPQWPDTFRWIAGPEIEAFFKRHGIKKLVIRNSDEPNETSYYFSKDHADIATLFKLTFG